MSDQSPYTILGVAEDASFEEIQEARQRLMQEHGSDRKQQEAIESAYDAVLMDRLRLRKEGRIKVPDRVRFPEKSQPTSVAPQSAIPAAPPGWLASFWDTPSPRDVLYPGGVAALLALLCVAVPPGGGAMLQTAWLAAVLSNLYFITRKENRFGRAILLTLVGLVLAVLLSFLLSLVVPFAQVPFQFRPDTWPTLVMLLVLWLVSSFLR